MKFGIRDFIFCAMATAFIGATGFAIYGTIYWT